MAKKAPEFDLNRYIVTIRDEEGRSMGRLSVFAKSKAAACSMVMGKARIRSASAEVASIRAARAI